MEDWDYYVRNAKIMCDTVRKGEPPGNFGFDVVKQVVRSDEPTWTTPQILNYSAAIYNWYCPEMWGPTDEQVAAMPPEQRLKARSNSCAGMMEPIDMNQMTSIAQNICQMLDGGTAYDKAVHTVHDSNKEANPQFTEDVARGVVGASVEAYCPAYTR